MRKADHKQALKSFERMPKYHNYRYHNKCDRCGKVFLLYTQSDDEPEYYTNLAISCECGGRAYFQLPVN